MITSLMYSRHDFHLNPLKRMSKVRWNVYGAWISPHEIPLNRYMKHCQVNMVCPRSRREGYNLSNWSWSPGWWQFSLCQVSRCSHPSGEAGVCRRWRWCLVVDISCGTAMIHLVPCPTPLVMSMHNMQAQVFFFESASL